MKLGGKAELQEILIKFKQEVEPLFEEKQIMILYRLNLEKREVEQSILLSQNNEVKKLYDQFQQLYEDALEDIAPEIKLNDQTILKFNEDLNQWGIYQQYLLTQFVQLQKNYYKDMIVQWNQNRLTNIYENFRKKSVN
ncbi:unnamed protein product [Paramecium sonneborni]|uniref:Uncharacterized protein n=1 Tax=Paramecium sonneborni TaxID=65129 RepID=A0A8S1MKZ9_9CILI|nr:unnamed protein product [Paramecium sonneborni]